MKFKVLSEHCVKVLMETEDICRFDLPFTALHAEDEKTLEFIYRLLFLVWEETGISFVEGDVTVTARSGCGSGYYIVITRGADPAGDGIRLVKDIDAPENAMLIYTFKEYRDILGLRHCVRRFPAFVPKTARLQRYGGYYYIVLEFTPVQIADRSWQIFETELGEFYQKCKKPFETEALLTEHGTLVCDALPEILIRE